jgi:hypothetical protein
MRSETSFELDGDLIVVDVADLGHAIDGVLGMNVLSGFNFEIRPAERRILVEKIPP